MARKRNSDLEAGQQQIHNSERVTMLGFEGRFRTAEMTLGEFREK